jgi:hypothetical protein
MDPDVLQQVGLYLRPRHVAVMLQVCKGMKPLDNQEYWGRCAAHAFFRQSMAMPVGGVWRIGDGGVIKCLNEIKGMTPRFLFLTNLHQTYKSAIDAWVGGSRNYVRSIIPTARALPDVEPEFLELLEHAAKPEASAVSLVIAGDAIRTMSVRRSVFHGVIAPNYDHELRCMKAFFRRELSIRVKSEIGGLPDDFDFIRRTLFVFLRSVDDDDRFHSRLKEYVMLVIVKEFHNEYNIYRMYKFRSGMVLRHYYPKFPVSALIYPKSDTPPELRARIIRGQSLIMESAFFKRLGERLRTDLARLEALPMSSRAIATIFTRKVRALLDSLPADDERSLTHIPDAINFYWNLGIQPEGYTAFELRLRASARRRRG